MAPPVTPIVRNTSSELLGGFDLSITVQDGGGDNHGGWPLHKDVGNRGKACDPVSSSAFMAASDFASQVIDLSNSSSSLSPVLSPYKGKLPVVLEESESLSHREGSSVWDESSSSSSFSITSSSPSSTRTFFRRGSQSKRSVLKAEDSWERSKNRSECKKASLASLLLQPFKILRDGYMSCMMGLEGAGDLSALAQGSVFASSGKYFADEPISRRDAKNYG